MALRFLHTSDIHLLDLQGVMPWRYFGKRLTGRMNLAFHRSKTHDGALFDEMMSRLGPLGIERVVVTGDLTNLSLESEFELVRRKLDALSVPSTVIPGNHDAYTWNAARSSRFERYLDPHMQGERERDTRYPFMTRVDDVALIGVSTAIATWPFYATGRVGTPQLERFERMLARARRENLCRIVLIHHPVVEGVAKGFHRLLDLAAFAEVIARQGAELVLHGHEHRRIETSLPGPDSDVPVHGIGSGTSLSEAPHRQAAFSVYQASSRGITRELYIWNGYAFEHQDA